MGWTVSLVDEDSVHDVGSERANNRYAKLIMLPKVGGWKIAAKGFSDQAWTTIKNLNSGDDNWTVESPIKLLHNYADIGFDIIINALYELMQSRTGRLFAFQKTYNLNHLARSKKKNVEPENLDVDENLVSILTDSERKYEGATTIFQSNETSWKVLIRDSPLGPQGEPGASQYSEQYDTVYVILSDTEAKATILSLRAKLEIRTLDELKDAMYRV